MFQNEMFLDYNFQISITSCFIIMTTYSFPLKFHPITSFYSHKYQFWDLNFLHQLEMVLLKWSRPNIVFRPLNSFQPITTPLTCLRFLFFNLFLFLELFVLLRWLVHFSLFLHLRFFILLSMFLLLRFFLLMSMFLHLSWFVLHLSRIGNNLFSNRCRVTHLRLSILGWLIFKLFHHLLSYWI